jgi:hypothetical protein
MADETNGVVTKDPSDSVKGLPKTLKILGKRFRIHLLAEDEDTEVDGRMYINKQVIAVRPQEALEQVQDTSLHEALHAISDSLSLGLRESQVHQLAAAVLALLKDNKAYSQWLMKDDD